MSVQVLSSTSFPRNEHVEIHVRKIELRFGDDVQQYVEIREFIKSGEVWGHGIVIPNGEVKELRAALDQLGLGLTDSALVTA